MRELERDAADFSPALPRRIALVGRGRLGSAIAAALDAAGLDVVGPLGRGQAPDAPVDAVLLCVPDAAIADAAATVAGSAPLIGHTSGATPVGVLGARDAFGLHPLQTFTAEGGSFSGVGCAIGGTTPRALEAADALARCLAMHPFELADSDRPAYHAAASIASNFLVTIEGAAEQVAAAVGLDRDLLAPLVRQTVDNWAALGAERALTGPVARGDEETVARQRAAIEDVAPELIPLWDELVAATRALTPANRQPPTANGTAVVTTVGDLRAALKPARQAGKTIALVPTMGFFHEGHLALMRAARAAADVVVVSLFVNPTQFGPGEDLSAYPRDFERDRALAEAEGADLLFAPSVEEVYPDGFDITVSVGGVTETLEGQSRPGHFDGVATIVTKLFNMVGPDVAFFGQKDAQQALVIRKLVRDLDIPVRVEVAPTVRERDGLAMSSRNAYLEGADRERAAALSRALAAAEREVAAGRLDAGAVLAAARAELDAAGVTPEYLELRSATDLSPAERVNGNTLLAVAARVGRARLIDNTMLGGT
jgi:pantoate--beta-alanine ligase